MKLYAFGVVLHGPEPGRITQAFGSLLATSQADAEMAALRRVQELNPGTTVMLFGATAVPDHQVQEHQYE